MNNFQVGWFNVLNYSDYYVSDFLTEIRYSGYANETRWRRKITQYQKGLRKWTRKTEYTKARKELHNTLKLPLLLRSPVNTTNKQKVILSGLKRLSPIKSKIPDKNLRQVCAGGRSRKKKKWIIKQKIIKQEELLQKVDDRSDSTWGKVSARRKVGQGPPLLCSDALVVEEERFELALLVDGQSGSAGT